MGWASIVRRLTAHGTPPHVQLWRAEVGIEGSEREVDGAWAWLGVERGGGLSEDDMVEDWKRERKHKWIG